MNLNTARVSSSGGSLNFAVNEKKVRRRPDPKDEVVNPHLYRS